MPKGTYGGGNKGNKSVTGKYRHSAGKKKSMIGGSGSKGRRSGGKMQRKMLTG